jgi:stringent starvation protein B
MGVKLGNDVSRAINARFCGVPTCVMVPLVDNDRSRN